MDDLRTLKLDQRTGRIIEFPLAGVSRVYHLPRCNGIWYTPEAPLPKNSGDIEHVVVIEFMRRNLAFVFKEFHVSQSFLMCLELLTRRVQQQRSSICQWAAPPCASGGAGSCL